jgi:dihydroorotate dehydrogenase electron transfer subunit
MEDTRGTVTLNRKIAGGYHLLRLRLAKPMGKVQPGQFVMVKVPDKEIFLRRPFSIYDCGASSLTLMYRVVGAGTESLSRTQKGAEMLVLGPLGKGFRIEKRDVYLIVAGGIGIAGVHRLAKTLGGKGVLFFGCSTKEEAVLLGVLGASGAKISTLDGSCGFKGNVVELLRREMESLRGESLEVFACGPEGMVRSLRSALEPERVPCQVLLEERMACGLGLCFGCVKKTVDEEEPYKRVCREGPVFDLWQICL